MNINNLEPYVGHYIKDYKNLCLLLEEGEKNGGTSRSSQITEWERYFAYERKGNQYKIVQIYDEPIPKQDGRSNGNNSKYVLLIEPILINYLINSETKSKVLTKKKWFITIGMANQSYGSDDYERWLLKNFTNSFNYNKFMQYSKRKLKDTFLYALNNMKKRMLINWEEQIFIMPFEGEGFVADKNDEIIIKEVEDYVIKDLNCDSMWDIYSKSLANKFYRRCDELVQKKYQWSYYFKQILIELKDHDTIDISSIDEIGCMRQKLNNEIIKSVIKSISTDIRKQLNKYSDWGKKYSEDNLWDTFLKHMIDTGEEEMLQEDKPFMYMDNFIDMQIGLAEKILRINMAN